jgi:hypothetical protein
VSRAAMGLSKTTAPDVRIESESAGAPPEMAEDEQPPLWLEYQRERLLGREDE